MLQFFLNNNQLTFNQNAATWTGSKPETGHFHLLLTNIDLLIKTLHIELAASLPTLPLQHLDSTYSCNPLINSQ